MTSDLASGETRHNQLSVSDYIRKNQADFARYYANLIEDYAFLSNIRFYLSFTLVLSNISNFTRTHDPLSLTVNLPSITMLLCYPGLRRRKIIPDGFGTIWCFIFLVVLALQWSFSFWIFAKNDLQVLGPTVISLVLSALWMFALGPSPLLNMLKALFASSLFIGLMSLVNPGYIAGIKGSLVVGILLGLGFGRSMDQMLRFRFYIVRQNLLLEEKKAKIDSIFRASPVGMLTLERNSCVGSSISPSIVSILGSDLKEGTHFKTILDASLCSEAEKHTSLAALEAIIDEPLLAFELNCEQLVDRVSFQRSDRVHSIKLSYSPLLDTQGLVREILVLFDDVTEAEQHAFDYRIANIEGATLLGFIRLRGDQSSLFLETCRTLLQAFERIAYPPGDAEQAGPLLRQLHTVKGNARTLGMKDLAELVHEVETEILGHCQLKGAAARVWEYTYARSLQSILNFLLNFQADFLTHTSHSPELSLEDHCRELMQKTAQKAAELSNKLTPDIHVTVGPGQIDQPHIRKLAFQILPHLVNNAVDHGIESAEDRVASGKPARGRLSLAISQEQSNSVWRISDDGRGLALERLRAKRGTEAQQDTDEVLAQSIFQAGLSTAEQLTQLSGRGVGLDAVAEAVEALGGSVKVSLLGEPSPFRAFVIEMIVPLVPAKRQSA